MNFLIFLLFINSASATILAKFRSSPEGTSEQRFEITGKKVLYVKKSNFFDKTKSYSLGEFVPQTGRDFSAESAKLEALLDKVITVDELLKKTGSSFNDLSSKDHHESIILLNGYRITQSSDLYPELKSIFERLQDLKWKLDKGVVVAENLKSVAIFEGGKEVGKKEFSFQFQCQKKETPTICFYKPFGILYVQ